MSISNLERRLKAKSKTRISQLESLYGSFDGLALKEIEFSQAKYQEDGYQLDASPKGVLNNTYAQLAKYLDVDTKDVMLLKANPQYQQALERQLARMAYSPIQQAIALQNIAKMAMGVHESAKAADSIMADKHLRSITQPPQEATTGMSISVTFEGLTSAEVRSFDDDKDAIDVEYREIQAEEEASYESKTPKMGGKQSDKIQGKEKEAKIRHSFAREGDSPSNYVTELYKKVDEPEFSLFEIDNDSARQPDDPSRIERQDFEGSALEESTDSGGKSISPKTKISNDRHDLKRFRTRGWDD